MQPWVHTISQDEIKFAPYFCHHTWAKNRNHLHILSLSSCAQIKLKFWCEIQLGYQHRIFYLVCVEFWVDFCSFVKQTNQREILIRVLIKESKANRNRKHSVSTKIVVLIWGPLLCNEALKKKKKGKRKGGKEREKKKRKKSSCSKCYLPNF